MNWLFFQHNFGEQRKNSFDLVWWLKKKVPFSFIISLYQYLYRVYTQNYFKFKFLKINGCLK